MEPHFYFWHRPEVYLTSLLRAWWPVELALAGRAKWEQIGKQSLVWVQSGQKVRFHDVSQQSEKNIFISSFNRIRAYKTILSAKSNE